MQLFGYPTRYMKLDSIKHKRKKINGKWYDTRKSDLMYYKNDTKHVTNDFRIVFIYKTMDDEYFYRIFNTMEEYFEICAESALLWHLNNERTLF